MSIDARRLTIVQYAGDFREAAERLAAGGPENYRGQRYTVDYVEGLASRLGSVTTIAGVTDDSYDVVLPSGGRAIGAGFRDGFDGAKIARLVAETKPDLLVLRAPIRPVMAWAVRHRVRTLLLLADSFNDRSVKGRLTRLIFTTFARFGVFDIIANHGARAAQQLVDIGVSPAKVIAWDYPPFDTPHDRPAKHAAGAAPHLLYVGLLTAEKGVDDLIVAIGLLARRGITVTADLIGKGDDVRLRALVDAHGLSDAVRLPGIVPNKDIVDRMAAADIVVVPSRHDYPEGMPLTIYEGYCSRTPLIVSDHPMFVGNVVHDISGLVFAAGQADKLAAHIERLLADPALYAAISANGIAAWERLQIPVKWDVLIDQWIANDQSARAWLRDQSLA